MVKVERYPDNKFVVHFLNISIFDIEVAMELEREVNGLLEKGNSIMLNFSGIKSIKSEGFNRLYNLHKKSLNLECNLKFTSVDDDIYELINGLDYNEEG